MDPRKRARTDGADGSGGAAASKRIKETGSYQSGLGSKSKPCTKFFSIVGCPFGDRCHFLHYVPGGAAAISHMTNLGHPGVAPAINQMPHSTVPIGFSATAAKTSVSHMTNLGHPGVALAINQMPHSTVPIGFSATAAKTRMCNKYNTPDGCKFGDKCHFAHGEWELGKPFIPSHEGHWAASVGGRLAASMEIPRPSGIAAATSFGASANAKISVDSSLAGAIIGKGGMRTKEICRITGVKLAIREHEADPNLRNIQLEGTFDQIKHASSMVRELIVNVSSATQLPAVKKPVVGIPGALGNSYKTKICDNFTRGSCTYGDRCHFAHGAGELRKSAI
ncbi:hypothetical protein Cni_G21130 [Canna indica]|uniref:C3H1-type domain-containing protein n=1 Tax=Canna indica TaxID=4628 RepID=A0AAQ3KQ67_9LILI|nr:hypothetical protein Cni_G21130 [Canna indica]